MHAAGDAAGLAALLAPDGRLTSALGATSEQVGWDDITVAPVMGSARPEKLAALLDAAASGALRVPLAHLHPRRVAAGHR